MEYIKAQIMYPFLKRQNPLNKKYTLDLVNLDEATISKLKKAGVTLKKDTKGKGKGDYIVISSNKYPANVYDSRGNELPDSVVNSMGSGSVVSVPLKTYQTEYQGDIFTKVTLGNVRVHEYVEYKPEGLDDEDGFVYGGPQDDSDPHIDVDDDDLDDDIPF
jgi:hypothetical protein